jgi:hypothetical protein
MPIETPLLHAPPADTLETCIGRATAAETTASAVTAASAAIPPIRFNIHTLLLGYACV